MLTEHAGQLPRQFLTGKSDQVGGGDHGYVVQGEDPVVKFRGSEVDSYRCGHKGPKDIDKFGCQGRAPEGDFQELPWVHALAPAFTVGLDAAGNLVAVVVESR